MPIGKEMRDMGPDMVNIFLRPFLTRSTVQFETNCVYLFFFIRVGGGKGGVFKLDYFQSGLMVFLNKLSPL